MAVSLKKGQKSDLTKNRSNLKKILVKLGYQSDSNIEIDSAAFLLSSNGKVSSDSDFIFYNNLKHPSGAVKILDNDAFEIDLEKIPSDVTKIDFTLTIYEGQERHQNFGKISRMHIEIIDEFGEELIRYDLGEDFSIETAIVVGEIYRYKSEWKFNAIGAGWSGGLNALGVNFGLNILQETSLVPVQKEIVEFESEPEIIPPPDRIIIDCLFKKNFLSYDFPKLNVFLESTLGIFESTMGLRTNISEGSGNFSSYPHILIDAMIADSYKKFFKININGKFVNEMNRILIAISNIKCDCTCDFSNAENTIGLSIDVNSNDGAWSVILLQNIGGNFMIQNVAECFSSLKALKDIHDFNF